MSVTWSRLYAQRLEGMSTSVIREILKVAQSPDIIPFAGGWPEAELFPIEQINLICEAVLNEHPRESLQYGMTDGEPLLRGALAAEMRSRGIPAAMENIVIVSGSQQALDLLPRILIDPGDTILVENPTFLGAIQSFSAYGPHYVSVPLDEEGACAEAMERVLADYKVKFMYLIPTFHNPTGITMSLRRRERIVALATEAGVPIIEDDPYGRLRYRGEALPTLAAIDAARNGNDPERATVIYSSTFSKTLAPGLRLAWVVCPTEIAHHLVMAKQGVDLHTSGLSQMIAYEFMDRGWLDPQVERIRETYRVRCDAMCQAIDEFFPPQAHYVRPDGGLFLWVTLPRGIDTAEMLKDAAARKVAFVPGAPFFVDGDGANTFRMTFASVPAPVIREGIRILGDVIREHLSRL
ncbi:MAG: PLP-dependent aminotransferase family protein [Anaerolineae bacterium]